MPLTCAFHRHAREYGLRRCLLHVLNDAMLFHGLQNERQCCGEQCVILPSFLGPQLLPDNAAPTLELEIVLVSTHHWAEQRHKMLACMREQRNTMRLKQASPRVQASG